MNGDVLPEFSTEKKGERIQGMLVIPNWMRENAVGKVPIILLYHGKIWARTEKSVITSVPPT